MGKTLENSSGSATDLWGLRCFAVAAGEGMSLLPSSFSAIHREGVAFVAIEEAGILQLQLGIAARQGADADLLRLLKTIF